MYKTHPYSEILQKIGTSAKDADEKAANAFKKSKYTTFAYWIGMEFVLQRLYDDIAKKAGLEERCPWYRMRELLALFKKQL